MELEVLSVDGANPDQVRRSVVFTEDGLVPAWKGFVRETRAGTS